MVLYGKPPGEVEAFVKRWHRRRWRRPVLLDPGDETLARLLGELGCPLPLHQVRMLVLGALAGAEVPSLYRLRAALWDGEGGSGAGRGPARDALELLAGLRARLAVHREGTVLQLMDKCLTTSVPVASCLIHRHRPCGLPPPMSAGVTSRRTGGSWPVLYPARASASR